MGFHTCCIIASNKAWFRHSFLRVLLLVNCLAKGPLSMIVESDSRKRLACFYNPWHWESVLPICQSPGQRHCNHYRLCQWIRDIKKSEVSTSDRVRCHLEFRRKTVRGKRHCESKLIWRKWHKEPWKTKKPARLSVIQAGPSSWKWT